MKASENKQLTEKPHKLTVVVLMKIFALYYQRPSLVMSQLLIKQQNGAKFIGSCTENLALMLGRMPKFFCESFSFRCPFTT